MTITIVDRKTGKIFEEVVYGKSLIQLLYKGTIPSRIFCFLVSKLPFASYVVGLWQKFPFSKGEIGPFVKRFHINLGECERQEFASFNDFFIRKLKPGVRPIAASPLVAPADGRYLVYENIGEHQEVFAKGQKLSIAKLLQGKNHYVGGSMIVARLAPPDYHRFHFPVDGTPAAPRLIGGYLYSVNPMALRKHIEYLSENKRVVVGITTETMGKVAFIAIGATSVGSIQFTYQPGRKYKRGDELGYFSFGASMVIVLTEKQALAKDLLANTTAGHETLCQMGETLRS